MRIRCPHCKIKFDVKTNPAGHALCPSCHRSFVMSMEDTIDHDGPTIRQPLPQTTRRIGRFDLISQLGVGSQAEVWRARDELLHREVAVKVSRTLQIDGNQLDHFQNEAYAVARLDHPYIASVYNIGTEDDRFFIVQQFVDGIRLDEWAQANEPSPADVASICAKVARALFHAHQREVIHRDIKPSNVIVDENGDPHIVDFGIARHNSDKTLDGDELFIGTPAYMSPEQARAAVIDHRTDIYALGAVMYEMLTQVRPLVGNNITELIATTLNDVPDPPSRIVRGLPIAFDMICLRCLEKDPKKRYSSAADLAEDLERVANETAPLASEQRRMWQRMTDWLKPKPEDRHPGKADISDREIQLAKENERLHLKLAARTQMLLAVTQEQELYQSLVQNLPLCVFRKDLAGTFAFANEFFTNHFGPAEGKNAEEIFAHEIALKQDEEDRKVLESGEASQSLLELPGPTGETICYEVIKHPVRNVQGDVIGIQGLMWDVSAHTRLETMLRKAKEAAEEANRSKSAFLANMSHELRTPLHGILGNHSLLRQDKLVLSRQKGSLGAIENCANHLIEVIDDVLNLSKIESGRLQVTKKETDFYLLLRRVSDIVRARAEEKGLEFTIDAPAELPRWIHADGQKIRQILVNLIGNAVKFTPEGHVTLRILPLEDNRLTFQVEDSGIGIDKSKRNDIMQPFVVLSEEGGGTGLGLAITKQLLDTLEGTLEVESQLGEGSTFHVTLPIEETRKESLIVDDPDDDQQSFSELKASLQTAANRKILVVDDVKTNRDVLNQHLRQVGFHVQEASNGQDALARMESFQPDLVFLDIRMPGMNGFEAIRQMRLNPDFGDTKIIAVTASVFHEDTARITDAGFDDFLGKPFHAIDLLRKLCRHFDVKRSSPDSATTSAEQDDMIQLCQQLDQAVNAGDIEQLNNLAQKLKQEPHHREFTGQVIELIESFQLSSIVPLTREFVSQLESRT